MNKSSINYIYKYLSLTISKKIILNYNRNETKPINDQSKVQSLLKYDCLKNSNTQGRVQFIVRPSSQTRYEIH
jgi:hypothetical protein